MKNEYIFSYEPKPTEENIEYAFQRLLLSVYQSSIYKEYINVSKDYNEIFKIITKWIKDYTNTKKLSQVDSKEFEYVKQKLFELDTELLPVNGLYAEDSYEWIIQLEILINRIKEDKKKED